MSGQDNNETSTPESVASLVEGFRLGQSSASEAVRQRVRRILVFRGFRIAHEDRLDLEQTVMTQLWRAVTRPGFEAKGFWGFVEVVTCRRCVDWIRAHRPEMDLDMTPVVSDPRSDPLRDILGKERAELAQAALARLPEGCRELVELHTGQGKTYAEMAEILGRSEGALRVQMHRCIQRAHRILSVLVQEGNVTEKGTQP